MSPPSTTPSPSAVPAVLLLGEESRSFSAVAAALHDAPAIRVEVPDRGAPIEAAAADCSAAVVCADGEDGSLWKRVMGLARPPCGLPVLVVGPETLRTTSFLIGAEDWIPADVAERPDGRALVRAILNAVIRRRVAGGLPPGGHLVGLVTGIAHEVNNPLTVINADLEHACEQLCDLSEQLDDSELKEALVELGEILEDDILASRRITAVTRALQNLSRLADTVPAALHTGPAVRRVLGRLAAANPSDPVPTVHGDTEWRIHASVHGFEEALFNILQNSLYANRVSESSEGVEVWIDGHADHVDFRVTDRGPGVRADISGRELRPFVTSRPPGEGLGLGLTVAALAIQRAGGTLTVQPREGGGTEVYLHFLPAKQGHLPAFEEDPATDAD